MREKLLRNRGNFRLLVKFLLSTSLIASSLNSIAPAYAAPGTITSGSCTSAVGESSYAIIAQSGTDCIATFTASNQQTTTTNSWTVPTGVAEIQLLVVGGGGGGGARSGGGGGAGGYVYLENVGVIPGNSMSLQVGKGGDGGNTIQKGINGDDSYLTLKSAAVNSTTVTAKGGGGGGTGYSSFYAGSVGGSGGGSAGSTATANPSFNQSTQNYGNGNAGAIGTQTAGVASSWSGGGGGGSNAAAVVGTTSSPSSGGAGTPSSITGTNTCYAAGGGAGAYSATAVDLTNGGACSGIATASGGGGSKGSFYGTRANYNAGNAADNTGSGGGGGGFNDAADSYGGKGSAGVVVIRWTIPGTDGALPYVSGLSARFNATNFNTTLNGGLGTWADSSGSAYHIAGTNISGTAITMGTTGSNANGSNKSFNVVNGTYGSNIQMLSAANLSGKYTLFTVARYSGTNRQRIFQATTENATNYLSGFYGGYSGVYYKSGWYTAEAQPTDVTRDNWLVSSECSYDPNVNTTANSCSATYSANGRQRNYATNTITSATYGLGINGKGYYTAQYSDFQIADVLVFNRVLTITEENDIETYISKRYGIAIYSDQIVNYDPADSSTTNWYLKNLPKDNSSLIKVDALDMTLYNRILESPENSGILQYSLANGSYGQTANLMKPMTRFTGSAWFKQTGNQGGGWNSILTTAYNTAGEPIGPTIATYNGNMNAGYFDGASWQTGYASLTANAYAVSDDVWYHVEVTYDGVNVRLYVNGTLIQTTASTSSLLKNDMYLRLGTRWDGSSASYGFNGAIGRTRIYDHALTDAEVLAEYNADKSRYNCITNTSSNGGKTIVSLKNATGCSWTAPTGVTKVRALLVGGGGGGGSWVAAGGGGGGVVDRDNISVTPGTTYSIIVGGGGKPAYKLSDATAAQATNGINTTAFGITAYGGGFGGSWTATGGAGATGGGGSYNTNTIASSYPAQGYAGGADGYNSTYGYPTGGGGGAGGRGGNGTVTTNVSGQSGNGGAGRASNITGSTAYYGGGGGGGCHGNATYPCYVGTGGSGGGGNGAGNGGAMGTTATTYYGGNGTDGTGGGGGGAGAPCTNTYNIHSQGGFGGSGIVIISYVNTFTVTYNYDGADGGNSTSSTTFSPGGTALTLPTPTKTNSTFGGWYLDSVLNSSAGAAGASYTPSGTSDSITLYARWLGDCSPTSATSGGYTTKTFSASGSCKWGVPNGISSLEVLVVGGGGGGGANVGAGGAGGGIYYSSSLSVTGGSTATIVVGAGGTGGSFSNSIYTAATNGLNSSYVNGSTSLIANGGSSGNMHWSDNTCIGNVDNIATSSSGGTASGSSGTAYTGGAGGASATAQNGNGSNGGAGTSITFGGGSAVIYGGGGGGGAWSGTGGTGGASASSGAGNGGTSAGSNGGNGLANRGGGGGGAESSLGCPSPTNVGGNGGSGVVIIRYAIITLTTPSTPSASATSNILKSIAITWTAVSNATSYTLKLYNSAGATLLATISSLATLSRTVNTADYSSFADNTGYQVSITAIGDGTSYANSSESTKASVTTNAAPVTPTISSNPGNASVASGGTATFTVVASVSDGGTITYQWSFSSDSGSTWNNVSSGSGGTSSSYTTAAINYSANAYKYRVIVTNTKNGATATATSTPALLTVTATSSTIVIALPNNATAASYQNAITITASVSVNGTVNFKLAGTSISGCSSVTSSGLAATCSWTPTATGTNALTAVLTPTDTNNYSSSTSVILNINVGTGPTATSIVIDAGQPEYLVSKNITATTSVAGNVNFMFNGKTIPGCFARPTNGSLLAVCAWKPGVRTTVTITATLTPTDSSYAISTSNPVLAEVKARSGARS